ncbi:MAG: ATPase [Candidatus Eisenbacteria bacterium]|nr:ATPase [Candidatus Eisenbacteria bacterium]
MRIAMPLESGRLAVHFGHCEQFALFDVDRERCAVTARQDVAAPPHQPGFLPGWLAQQGANVIISGGMGGRALALFADAGIEVVTGAGADRPEAIIEEFLAGELEAGPNICDH